MVDLSAKLYIDGSTMVLGRVVCGTSGCPCLAVESAMACTVATDVTPELAPSLRWCTSESDELPPTRPAIDVSPGIRRR